MLQLADIKGISVRDAISAVVGPCSARKSKPPRPELSAADLNCGYQPIVEFEWLKKLRQTPRRGLGPATRLYSGTGVLRLQAIAELSGAGFFVLSAGLGLVDGLARVPAYDLTLAPNTLGTVQSRIAGPFDPTRWWQAMQTGPFASPFSSLGEGRGRVLVALTKPYAKLTGHAFSQAPEHVRSRFRFFGASLQTHLPANLHDLVLPYDARLDAIVPGIRLDFSARALTHFISLVENEGYEEAKNDAARVVQALSEIHDAKRKQRPKVSDCEIKHFLSTISNRGLSMTQALGYLRNEEQVACEQSRFRRLYREVMV